jgi:hypothetical protein
LWVNQHDSLPKKKTNWEATHLMNMRIKVNIVILGPVIILFSKMLKFSKNINFFKVLFVKENLKIHGIFENISLVEMKHQN